MLHVLPEGVEGPEPEPKGRAGSKKWLYLLQRLVKDMAEVSARPRRDFTYWSIIVGTAVLAIISDFLGLMTALLGLIPEEAREAGLDQIYPVNGLKAYRARGKYHLRYPGDWLGDKSVAFSRQATIETLRQQKRVVPDAAFGPAGTSMAPAERAQSLSVVSQPVASESLEDMLGDPQAAFAGLSKETLASAGQSELLLAQTSHGKYEFEYLVTLQGEKGPFCIHCWSTVALKAGRQASELYLMTLVVPELMLTPERQQIYDKVWHSFELE